MNNTFWNIIVFLLSTIAYFVFLKPKLDFSTTADPNSYASYTKSAHTMLSIYFIGVILLQFFINSSIIINKCGGSSTANIGSAALLTFVPWFFIFGIVIVILIVFPGFKSAFSDVIGYFWVANKANAILSDLLVDTDVSAALNSENASPEQKEALQDAASVIMKITGNMSILINQIVPENFNKYWDVLTPLIKDKYKNGLQDELLQKKADLFAVVVTRDNIGEAFWYIYTAMLLISIVQFSIVSQGCTKDVGLMKANMNDYLSKQEAVEKKAAAASSVKYVNTVNPTA